MADGAPIDYSYSPSGLTIELVDLANSRPLSRPSSRISSRARSSLPWHPKLTLYRLLVIVSTVGLAVAKTATSYLNLTFASITLEWILGVVVFLFFHLLGAYEETTNRYLTWLFNVDYMEYFWVFLEKLTGFGRPHYISDEINTRHQTMGVHPLVTGYRIIVTVLVAGVGMTKSALLYGQEPMGATTVECVFGVGIATGLYWLGLYEASSIKVYPTLFHVEYSGGLSYITETVILFLHLFALLFCGAVSYGFYVITTSIISSNMSAKSNMGTIEDIVVSAVIWSSTGLMSLAGASGVFAFMYLLGRRYCASPLGQVIAGLPGVRTMPYVYRKYWLPTAPSFHLRPRFFYLKRLIIRQSVKILLNLFALYVTLATSIYVIAFSLEWYSLLMTLLKKAPWYGLLIYFLISLIVVPGILIAIGWVTYFVFKGFLTFFFEAWKDFTIDVELVDAPV